MNEGTGGFSSGCTQEVGSMALETVFSMTDLTGIVVNWMPAGIVRMSFPF